LKKKGICAELGERGPSLLLPLGDEASDRLLGARAAPLTDTHLMILEQVEIEWEEVEDLL